MWRGCSPLVDRLLPEDAAQAETLMWEAAAITEFRRHARSHLPQSKLVYLNTVLGTLQLMQHYGAPTRLLDWTRSPWVALYFSCVERFDDDGVLWCFNREAVSHKTFGMPESLSEDEKVQHLTRFDHMTSAESPIEWAKRAAKASDVLASFQYEFSDIRATAQQSVFTISGTTGANHADAIDRLSKHDDYRIIIPSALKPRLLDLLWRMNIGALTLFPGLEGAGRFITVGIRAKLALDDRGAGWVISTLEEEGGFVEDDEPE